MDELNIVFGIVTVCAFLFAIYVHFKTESKKIIEAANIARQQQQLKSAHDSIIGILHSIDAVVQIPKRGEATIEQLQDLARIARGQANILEKRLREETMILNEWRFGKLIASKTNSQVGPELTQKS